MTDIIKKITLANGKNRYRFVVDVGTDPKTGKRKQLTVTKDTKKEATRELSKIRHQTATGEYVANNKLTVNDMADTWYATAVVDVEESTVVGYRTALLPVREHLGHMRVQALSEDDVDSLVNWMLTAARKRGGTPGTGLSARSVQLTLFCLRSTLNLALRRKVVTRNVAEHTKIPKAATAAARAKRASRRPWTATEIQQFLGFITGDRLYAVLLLSLMGLRPEEVCGLRWEDLDLSGKGTLDVANVRTLVEGRVIEKLAKTEAGMRTLPLPSVALAALKAWKTQQSRERLALGEAYFNAGYVSVDEGGRPIQTDALRRYTYRLMDAAGMRRVRLYDARHACLTWMANNGVPDTVVSAWAGHADLGFTKRHYVHSDPESLRVAADRLGDLLGEA